ncbi:MAG: hypothetical protein EBR82_55015 [Caulobacteraceae bacterium]|nr:hypothetical protein [Caulobacteraceae bacterium]
MLFQILPIVPLDIFMRIMKEISDMPMLTIAKIISLQMDMLIYPPIMLLDQDCEQLSNRQILETIFI